MFNFDIMPFLSFQQNLDSDVELYNLKLYIN